MESNEADSTNSVEKSPKPVTIRKSRSRERRPQRILNLPMLKHAHNPTPIPLKNSEEKFEMKDIPLSKHIDIFQREPTSQYDQSRGIFSQTPVCYRLDNIKVRKARSKSRHRSQKPSQSVIIREESSQARRSPASSTSTKARTDSLMSDDSGSFSIKPVKSELSQIISQLLKPRAVGVKAFFANSKKWIYNKEDGTYCGRTCSSWLYITIYGIMYLIAQMAFTLFLLYVSLLVVNNHEQWPDIGKADLQTYAQNGIGLSAVPASDGTYPLIWYRSKDPQDYKIYIDTIDFMLRRRKPNATALKSLGPCGVSPFGYSETPCVLVRINKQIGWSGKALSTSSNLTRTAPANVKKWIQSKRMLWLHCDGINQHDKEHIQEIRYHPNPPGIDPNIFPMDMDEDAPLLGVQFTRFTKGLSIDIQCKLWYDTGTSAVEFVLFVYPEVGINSRRSLCKVC